jgi:glycosyltransferase involved in cell wall biosynthesis
MGDRFEAEGIPVLHPPRRTPLTAWLLGLLRKERPDVLHTHLARCDFSGGIARTLGPSVPWVCSVHDLYHRSWRKAHLIPFVGLLWKRAEALIAISQAVRDWLVGERGVRSDRVTVIPYGLDPEPFERPSRDLRAEWGLQGRPVIGAMGRFEPRKGHETLVRCMPAVLSRRPDAVLVIAGADVWGHGETVRSLVKSMGLESAVRFVGFQRDVPSFMAALDVFTLGSRSEGFGLVVAEAMAAGKPVVVRRISPFTEIVEDGKTGFLVPPDDDEAFGGALTTLLSDAALCRRLGAAGGDRARGRFSASHMAAETARVYGQVVAAHA